MEGSREEEGSAGHEQSPNPTLAADAARCSYAQVLLEGRHQTHDASAPGGMQDTRLGWQQQPHQQQDQQQWQQQQDQQQQQKEQLHAQQLQPLLPTSSTMAVDAPDAALHFHTLLPRDVQDEPSPSITLKFQQNTRQPDVELPMQRMCAAGSDCDYWRSPPVAMPAKLVSVTVAASKPMAMLGGLGLSTHLHFTFEPLLQHRHQFALCIPSRSGSSHTDISEAAAFLVQALLHQLQGPEQLTDVVQQLAGLAAACSRHLSTSSGGRAQHGGKGQHGCTALSICKLLANQLPPLAQVTYTASAVMSSTAGSSGGSGSGSSIGMASGTGGSEGHRSAAVAVLLAWTACQLLTSDAVVWQLQQLQQQEQLQARRAVSALLHAVSRLSTPAAAGDEWGLELELCLTGRVSPDKFTRMLQCCDRQDCSWLLALPALCRALPQPSLAFLSMVGSGTPCSSSFQHFLAVAEQMYKQLEAIDQQLISSSQLLMLAVCVAPGLLGLLSLLQLPQLAGQPQAVARLKALARNRMSNVQPGELMSTWEELPEQLRDIYVHAFRQAAMVAVLKVAPADAAMHAQFTHWLTTSSVFESIGQLLRALCDQRAPKRWSPYLSFHLFPAALQALLSQPLPAAASLACSASQQQLQQLLLLEDLSLMEWDGACAADAAQAVAEAGAQQQQEQQAQLKAQQREQQADVLHFVRAWLEGQIPAGTGTGTLAASLYTAADQLLHQCPMLQHYSACSSASSAPDGQPPTMLDVLLQAMSAELLRMPVHQLLAQTAQIDSSVTCVLLRHHVVQQVRQHVEAHCFGGLLTSLDDVSALVCAVLGSRAGGAASSSHASTSSSTQQQQGPASELQREVLLFLLDQLQQPVAANGDDQLLATASLLPTEPSALLHHADLWVRLLHAYQPAHAASTGTSSKKHRARAAGVFEFGSGRGSAHMAQLHSSLEGIVALVSSLCSSVRWGDVTVQELQHLADNEPALARLVAAVELHAPYSCSTWQADLQAAMKALATHEQQRQQLEAFYGSVCPALGASDLQQYVESLSTMQAALGTWKLADLQDCSMWAMHQPAIEAAARVAPLLGCTPFRNSLAMYAAAAAAAAAPSSAGLAGQQQQTQQDAVMDVPEGEAGAESQPPVPALQLTVAQICSHIPQILADFQNRWRAMVVQLHGNTGGPPVRQLLALWAHEQLPDVKQEFTTVQRWLSAQCPAAARGNAVTAEVVASCLRLCHASQDRQLAEQLADVTAIFRLKPSALSAAAQQLPRGLLTELDAPACHVAAACEAVEKALGSLAGQRGLLQQLGACGPLADFLEATKDDDLRRLTDGVEDHGDAFVRSANLSDLLEVSRVMRSLLRLRDRGTLEALLFVLEHAAQAEAAMQQAHRAAAGTACAPSSVKGGLDSAFAAIAARLKVCTENVHSFKALHGRLANRSQLTREVVQQLVRGGTYTFQVVPGDMQWSVAMSCRYSEQQHQQQQSPDHQLTLTELQELSSRVLLLAGNIQQQRQQQAQAGSSAGAAGSQQALITCLQAFAAEVPVAAAVVAAVEQLVEVGCFKYREWHAEVPAAADPAHRPQQLQLLLRQLQQDLRDWETQLAAKQADCQWLRYFQPQQLFVLQDFLLEQHVHTAGERSKALALLQFVNPAVGATLGVAGRTEASSMGLALLQPVNQAIGALKGVAGRMQACSKGSEANTGCSKSGVVSAGEVLTALAARLDELFDGLPAQHMPLAGQCSSHAASAPATTGKALPTPPASTPPAATAAAAAELSRAGGWLQAAPNTSRVAVVLQDATSSSIGIMMQAYGSLGIAPQPSHVVFCSSSTTWWETQLLLQRCFAASEETAGSQHQAQPVLFTIADVDTLPFSLQERLVRQVQAALGQPKEQCTGASTSTAHGHNSQAGVPLPRLLITCRGNSNGFMSAQLPKQLWQTPGLSPAALGAQLHQLMRQRRCAVYVITSDLPGQGKSAVAAQLAAGERKQLYPVQVADDMDAAAVIEQLQQWQPAAQTLHITLLGCTSPAAVNSMLFGLLMLDHVASGLAAWHRPAGACCVIIEVGNSLAHGLLKSIPMLTAASTMHKAALPVPPPAPGFQQLHCSFALDHVNTASPDMQLLCAYLAVSESGTLDRTRLTIAADGSIATEPAQQPCTPQARRQLLQRHFIAGREASMSFALLHTFVSVAAQQLRHMTGSCFFQPETLVYALGAAGFVRSNLLTCILQAAASFAVESCTAARAQQQQSQGVPDAGVQAAARAGSVVRWADSNHLLLLFNASDTHQSITALYRSAVQLPHSFRMLLDSQASRRQAAVVNYSALSHQQLLQVLLQLVQPTTAATAAPASAGSASSSGSAGSIRRIADQYILTADNLLKMALIHMRVQCGLPVVMMGDTGCGKTSLLKFLAQAAGVQLHVLNVHAGTSRADILAAVETAEHMAAARNVKPVWLFLDEANTCDHLGLLAALTVHRSVAGRPLHPGVSTIVACNPYRLKPHEAATPGLTGKLRRSAGLARLVYTVHPLPETLMDHVWDFGVLSPADESAYITAMVAARHWRLPSALVCQVLSVSQAFIRGVGNAWDVSLRDVRRCLRLTSWFEQHMRNRPEPRRTWASTYYWNTWSTPWGTWATPWAKSSQTQEQEDVQLRALLLAAMHTYHSRIGVAAQRSTYRARLCAALAAHGHHLSPAQLTGVLEREQADYLRRMELPAGIAVNAALRENVFVALVCILNKIPLFLVGKPGSSKSLALRLIHANLRGPDSSDPFFRTLPTLYFLSHQGSESSTSQGISRVFEAAKQHAVRNPAAIPVVLLDEVGLAELSPHNPLKALHALLEPGYPQESPDVAVVGISNWALDAAKMSRAVLLCRPEPDQQDLAETAATIWAASHNTVPDAAKQHVLQAVATAYHAYYSTQTTPDFHGLRDFYGLISTLCLTPALSASQLYQALLRNFGGPPQLVEQVIQSFARHVTAPARGSLPHARTLIRANICDPQARHLLVISSGDVALELVQLELGKAQQPQQQQQPQQRSRQQSCAVVSGSPYKDDQSDIYKYSVLSRIILHMEAGSKLILRDVGGIFGALYDMLNQNYTVVGGKRNCRIALGPYANPMCAVHDDFRCVVIMHPQQAAAADPSLLNRFEKQWIECEQLLPESQRRLVLVLLRQWAADAAAVAVLAQQGTASSSAAAPPAPAAGSVLSSGTVAGAAASGPFGQESLFLGLHEDSLPCLTLTLVNAAIKQQPTVNPREVLGSCRAALLAVASMDGVARACNSRLLQRVPAELAQLVATFLATPKHSMVQFVAHKLQQHEQHLQAAAAAAAAQAAAAALSSPASPMEIDAAGPSSSSREHCVAAAPSTAASNATAAAVVVQRQAVPLWFIMTHSHQHTAVASLLEQQYECCEYSLDAFSSEADVLKAVQGFLQRTCTAGSGNSSASGSSQQVSRAQLLVLHANASQHAGHIQHLRHVVKQCLAEAGLLTARACFGMAGNSADAPCQAAVGSMSHGAAPVHLPVRNASASEPSSKRLKPSLQQQQQQEASQPLVAICIVVHVPIAPAVPLPGGWQVSWLSGWQQVTIDSLEGCEPWLWKLLSNCLAAAAGVQDLGSGQQVDSSSGGLSPMVEDQVAAEETAVAGLPVEELMGLVLLRALCMLPYPSTPTGARRVQQLAEQLCSPAAAGMWNALCTAVRRGLVRSECLQQGPLHLAHDALQLQLHGSLAAAVRELVLSEVAKQLAGLLHRLEQDCVLDAYWRAGADMQKEVDQLLYFGNSWPSTALNAPGLGSLSGQPPQLQLPISGPCFRLLQAAKGSVQNALLLASADCSPSVAAMEVDYTQQGPFGSSSGGGSSSSSNGGGGSISINANAEAAVYRLDELLEGTLGAPMAHLLKQHAAVYKRDFVLLAARLYSPGGAEGSAAVVAGSRHADTLMQLLESLQPAAAPAAAYAAAIGVQHPLQWHLLAWEHAPVWSAVTHIVSCCGTDADSAQPQPMDVDEAGVPFNAADGASARLVQALHAQLLPTTQCLEGHGGISSWCTECLELQRHCTELQQLLPAGCKGMLLNLQVLAQLAQAVQAHHQQQQQPDAKAAMEDLLTVRLDQVACLMAELREASLASPDILQRLLAAADELLGGGQATTGSASATGASACAATSFTVTLLTASLQAAAALAAQQPLQPNNAASAGCAALVQCITDHLLGMHCAGAFLPVMVHLLEIAGYQDGWLLLEDVQLLCREQHSPSVVWACLQRSLVKHGCGPDDAPVALLAAAVQQQYFAAVFDCGRQQHSDAPAAARQLQAAARWVDRSARLLRSSEPSQPPVVVAVAVAFLRAATDAVAGHISRARGTAASTSAAAAVNVHLPAAVSAAWDQLVAALDAAMSSHTQFDRMHGMLVYLLKALKGGQSMAELQQQCQRLSAGPLRQSLAGISLGSSTKAFAADPFAQVQHYEGASQLLARLVQRPTSGSALQAAFQQASNSPAHARALLAAAAWQLYLPGASSSGNRGVEQARAAVLGQMQGAPLDGATEQLLQCIVGNKWAQAQQLLQLMPHSSHQQRCLASVAVHLALGLATSATSSAVGTSSSASAERPAVSGFLLPLVACLVAPGAAGMQYIPAMPSDDATEVLGQAVGAFGPLTTYRCQCGVAYVITECGLPTQQIRCPSSSCRYTLGGVNHRMNEGQQQGRRTETVQQLQLVQQQRGYVARAQPTGAGVRGLGPAACQLLHLLVHAALLMGAAAGLQPAGTLKQLLGAATDAAAVERCQQALDEDWRLLLQSLQCSQEQLWAVLHGTISRLLQWQDGSTAALNTALTTPQARHDWEVAFQRHIAAAATSNPQQALQQMLAAEGQGAAGGNFLVVEVQEALLQLDGQYSNSCLPRLLRTVRQPSLQLLTAAFRADPANAARYPVTHAALQAQTSGRLALLPQLPLLTAFERSMRREFGHGISRAAARATPLASLLQRRQQQWAIAGSSGSMRASGAASGDAQRASSLVQQYQRFAEAWNACSGTPTRHECRDITIPTLEPNTACAVLACLSSRDEGRVLLALLAELAQRQNGFLMACVQQRLLQQEQQETGAAGGVMAARHTPTRAGAAAAAAAAMAAAEGEGQPLPPAGAGLPAKPLQQAQLSDVVDVASALRQLEQRLASGGLAWPGLEYGSGQQVCFDLPAIERLLASQLLAGKSLLDAGPESLELFTFKGELFRSAATLLHEVSTKVPQQPLQAGVAAGLADALQKALPPGTSLASLLPHFGVLLTFAKRTGAQPGSSVAGYVAAWLPAGPTRQVLLGLQALQGVAMQQLVAVYEALEDRAAPVAMGSINPVYNRPLTKALEAQLLQAVGVAAARAATAAHQHRLPVAWLLLLSRGSRRVLESSIAPFRPMLLPLCCGSSCSASFAATTKSSGRTLPRHSACICVTQPAPSGLGWSWRPARKLLSSCWTICSLPTCCWSMRAAPSTCWRA